VTVLRTAVASDLDAVNRVIERAVGTWGLPERVHRLSLPLYRYGAVDLQHLTVRVVERSSDVVGVAAWEPADPADAPGGQSALLLHGLYVDPAHHGQGLGKRLLRAAIAAARSGGFGGLLVRAQAQAVGFFEARGLKRLPVVNAERDYPHRYWTRV
jgi:GNAT superfamily N-acetyltransferase